MKTTSIRELHLQTGRWVRLVESHVSALLERFARLFNYGRYRLQAMVDIYNVFNGSPVLAYNTTFGQEWLRPTDVLQRRLVKIGGQLTF